MDNQLCGYDCQNLGKGSFDTLWRQWVRENGFDADGLSIYSARFTIIGCMYQKGFSVSQISAITGHSTNIVEVYIRDEELDLTRYQIINELHDYLRRGEIHEPLPNCLKGENAIGAAINFTEALVQSPSSQSLPPPIKYSQTKPTVSRPIQSHQSTSSNLLTTNTATGQPTLWNAAASNPTQYPIPSFPAKVQFPPLPDFNEYIRSSTLHKQSDDVKIHENESGMNVDEDLSKEYKTKCNIANTEQRMFFFLRFCFVFVSFALGLNGLLVDRAYTMCIAMTCTTMSARLHCNAHIFNTFVVVHI